MRKYSHPLVGSINRTDFSDISLSFGHLEALKLAELVLRNKSSVEKDEMIRSLLSIFEDWKNSHGVAIGKTEYAQLTRTIEEDNTERNIFEEIQDLEPWLCCEFVSSPLGLFSKLWGEDYPPLLTYLGESTLNYDQHLAALIIFTDNPEQEQQSGDCIEAALRLARLQISSLQEILQITGKEFETSIKRKQSQKMRSSLQKQATKERVLAAHAFLETKGKSIPLKQIADEANVSISSVSKILIKSGKGRYKNSTD